MKRIFTFLFAFLIPISAYAVWVQKNDTSGNMTITDGTTDAITIDSSGNLVFGALVDVNGTADGLVLDADGDTTLAASTDDQIDVEIAGADDFTFTANSFNVLSGSVVDLAGLADVLVVDADNDTTISADTDDQLNIELGGADQVILKAVAAADGGATTESFEIAYTTPVDTTGTNTHNALTIDLAIGNATGGTNTAVGVQIDGITGDAQVTEQAINIGSGWDEGINIENSSIFMPNEVTTATDTLTTAECGKIIFLNSATEYVTTLPAVSGAAGCEFTVIVQAAPSGAAYTIETGNSLENVLIGHVVTADIDGAADGDSSTADDTITFADGVAVVGDRVDLVSNGTSWYYVASAKVYNGITAAAQD